MSRIPSKPPLWLTGLEEAPFGSIDHDTVFLEIEVFPIKPKQFTGQGAGGLKHGSGI